MAVLDQPGIVEPCVAGLLLHQHGIEQLGGLGGPQLPAQVRLEHDPQAPLGERIGDQAGGLGERKAGGRRRRHGAFEITVRRCSAGDLEVDPALVQPVARDQFRQHLRPVGCIGNPAHRHRPGKPGGMVRPVEEAPGDDRRNLIDPLPEQQTAIEDRNLRLVLRQKLTVEPDRAHVASHPRQLRACQRKASPARARV